MSLFVTLAPPYRWSKFLSDDLSFTFSTIELRKPHLPHCVFVGSVSLSAIVMVNHRSRLKLEFHSKLALVSCCCVLLTPVCVICPVFVVRSVSPSDFFLTNNIPKMYASTFFARDRPSAETPTVSAIA